MSLWPSTIKILISNLPRTRKFSQLFKNTGGEDLLLSWTRVSHALRSIFMLWLVKIWQVSSCGKLMHHLETCLLWQLKLTEFCVNFRVNLWCFLMSFSTGSTKCNTAAIKSLLLFLAGWFIGFLVEKCSILKLVYFDSWSCQSFMKLHGWFVYWIFGWKMRRLSKSEIRFRMTSFSFFILLYAGWKVPQAAFRSCI